MTVRSESGKIVFASKNERALARKNGALLRQTLRDSRTPEEQLQLLEDRGHGHCDEAQRLVIVVAKQHKGVKPDGNDN